MGKNNLIVVKKKKLKINQKKNLKIERYQTSDDKQETGSSQKMKVKPEIRDDLKVFLTIFLTTKTEHAASANIFSQICWQF